MNVTYRLPILIVGASGHLGCLITEEFLKHNDHFVTSILIRNPEKYQDLCKKIEDCGGTAFQGDVCKPNTLKGCCKGIHTVISCLEGDDSVILEGQTNLLQECIKAQVQRFVPSDYSINIWNLPLGTHYFVDQQLKFRERLEKTTVHGLHFTVGVFMEAYFSIVEKEGFQYWGDLNTKFDLISMRDVAKFVVAGVSEKNRIGDVMVTGLEISMQRLIEVYNFVTGKNLQAEKMGNISDLRERINEVKEQGDRYEALKLGYMMLMFGGEGKILEKMNDKFPDVKVTGLEEFLSENKGKPINYYSMMSVAEKIDKEKLLDYDI